MKKEIQFRENQFYGNLIKYDKDDFIAIIKSKFGWSVSEQLNDILNGQSYAEQNENALAYIYEVAQEKGEYELAESLQNYLSN